jgi:hypothetical protein
MNAGTSNMRTSFVSTSTATVKPTPNIRMNETWCRGGSLSQASRPVAREFWCVPPAGPPVTRVMGARDVASISSASANQEPEMPNDTADFGR